MAEDRDGMALQFHLDSRSGVAPYLQLVQQVRRALRLGLLVRGDRLPTVKEVVAAIAINPNTVLKAYRELEHDGLVQPRPGLGTFVTRTLTDDSVAAHAPLRRELQEWLDRARRAGLDDESIEALFTTTFRSGRELTEQERTGKERKGPERSEQEPTGRELTGDAR